ncbi:MAG TPA: hypothetical protein VGH66_15220 [Acidimicrobiales bacterium]|jgi:hypothetical protein|nr:hypothetical protein [Trebonia sp.]
MSDEQPEIDWPPPQPDPETEPGEDPETHLLPNLDRIRGMDLDDLRQLVEAVRDWEGPLVVEFRSRAAARLAEP